MKKRKLKLSELKVQSFITSLDKELNQTLKAGGPGNPLSPIIETVTQGGSCPRCKTDGPTGRPDDGWCGCPAALTGLLDACNASGNGATCPINDGPVGDPGF